MVDYAIVSTWLITWMNGFEVLEFNGLFSDANCPVVLKLDIGCNDNRLVL